jgi:hypothetical protein
VDYSNAHKLVEGGARLDYIMKRWTHKRRLLLLHHEDVDYSNVHKLVEGGARGITVGWWQLLKSNFGGHST